MDEEELYAEPEGVLLADGGSGACFLVTTTKRHMRDILGRTKKNSIILMTLL